MVDRPQDMISDQKIEDAFNFITRIKGDEARTMLNEAIYKAAIGFHSGSSVTAAMRELKLFTKEQSLTKKGKRYARLLHFSGDFHL